MNSIDIEIGDWSREPTPEPEPALEEFTTTSASANTSFSSIASSSKRQALPPLPFTLRRRATDHTRAELDAGLLLVAEDGDDDGNTTDTGDETEDRFDTDTDDFDPDNDGDDVMADEYIGDD